MTGPTRRPPGWHLPGLIELLDAGDCPGGPKAAARLLWAEAERLDPGGGDGWVCKALLADADRAGAIRLLEAGGVPGGDQEAARLLRCLADWHDPPPAGLVTKDTTGGAFARAVYK